MFILFLVRFGLLSGHFLGKSCSLGLPYVLFVVVILVIFRFGFEGWICVLIASVPDLCKFLIFMYIFISSWKSRPSSEALQTCQKVCE